MRVSTIILMAIITLAAFAMASSSPTRSSRFLAGKGLGPKNDKKCSIDPSVCYGQGSSNSSCCGDSCVDLQTDPLNCGHCGKICKFTDSCCEGKCTDLNYNKRNCGSCGSRCNPGVLCYYGMCNYA